MEKSPSFEGLNNPDSAHENTREGYVAVLDALDVRVPTEIGESLSVHGREYPIADAADALVADAQRFLIAIKSLRAEINLDNDYYAEKAAAQLEALGETVATLNAQVAVLQKEYPDIAARLTEHVPVLSHVIDRGNEIWDQHAR